MALPVLEGGQEMRASFEERFWSKVQKGPGCWVWTAPVTDCGYGRIRIEGDRKIYAHRWTYEQEHGPIPDGFQIDHQCRNPACVRPAHLRAVSPKQNQENRAADGVDSISGVRNVSWNRAARRWVVALTHNRKRVFGGSFSDIEDAILAAEQLRRKYYTNSDRQLARGPM